MVLIAIALALILVSSLPSYQSTSFPSKGSRVLLPGKFSLEATASPRLLTPQFGISVIFTSNATLKMEMFNLNYIYAYAWFASHGWNASALENFATIFSSNLTLERDIPAGNTTFEYVPPRIENATVIVSNPTSAVIQWSFDSKNISVIASPERIFLAYVIAAPLGVALTIPRMVLTSKEKMKTKEKPPTPSV
jgi:hypothetical protein